MTTSTSADRVTIDCRGMQCPTPILRIAETARRHVAQPIAFDVLATDQDFPSDLEAWCRTTHARLVSLKTVNGVMEARVSMRGAVDTPPPVPVVVTSPEQSATLDLRALAGAAAIRKISEAAGATGHQKLHVVCDAPDFEAKVRAWAGAVDAVVTLVGRDGKAVRAVIEFPGDTEEAVPATQRPLSPWPGVAPTATEPVQAAAALVPVTGAALAAPTTGVVLEDRCTLLVMRNDLESLLAAMMVANACAAQGMKSNVFFSFWAVNLLRGEGPRPGVAAEPIGFLQRMMRWMMPRGPRAQTLGKMHMGGLGTRMMGYFMRRRNIDSLEVMLQNARDQGVTFSICSMSMGLMGLQRRDIIEWSNLEFAGVTSFSELARRSAVTLVF